MKKLLLALTIPVALLCSCNNNEFKVSGTVENADNETLVLARAVNGVWLRIDSIKTNGDGEFSFSEEAPDFPEIFRIERKGQSIYFPVDSTDRITIKTDTAGFGTRYTLSGTTDAEWMMRVDSTSRELAKRPFGDPEYARVKADFANQILKDPSSIVAYYIVNKIIGNHPLYSIENKQDVRIIGAVANAYNSYKPNDPRTGLLKAMFFTGRRMNNPVNSAAPKDTIHANEMQILEIALNDKNGHLRKLSEVTSHGKVVLLNFTTYLAAESPALNAELAKYYHKYAASGFEIYQVGYDDNEFSWKEAAKNLPWITVYDPAGLQSKNLVQYNVGGLPALFIINRQGVLSERITDLKTLGSTIAKYM